MHLHDCDLDVDVSVCVGGGGMCVCVCMGACMSQDQVLSRAYTSSHVYIVSRAHAEQ